MMWKTGLTALFHQSDFCWSPLDRSIRIGAVEVHPDVFSHQLLATVGVHPARVHAGHVRFDAACLSRRSDIRGSPKVVYGPMRSPPRTQE